MKRARWPLRTGRKNRAPAFRVTGARRTLEEAIAALEDLLATGEVLPSAQPRIEHRTSKPRPYVIVIGKKGKSVVESC